MKIISQALLCCLLLAPLAHSDNQQKTIQGAYSATFKNAEEAKLNTPAAAVDAACEQSDLAEIIDSDFRCKEVRDGHQCQQIQTILCTPRDNGEQP